MWRKSCSWLLLFVGLSLVLTAIGCSNGGSSNSVTSTPPAANSVQVRIGDAPSDSVLSFELNITKIDLVPQSGNNVTVLSSPAEIELTHLSGTLETLALANVTAGTYKGAAITVSTAQVTYIPAGSTTPTKKQFTLNTTVNVTFSPALTVGNGASVVNFDLNLAQSLTFDASGNLTGIAPMFNVTTTTAAPGGDKEGEDEEHGRWDNTVGKVTATTPASGSTPGSFTITLGMSGQSQTFQVDSNTKFSDGLSQLSDVKTGMLLKVNAVTQSDGTLLAREVEMLEASQGDEVEGIVTNTTGAPVTSIDVLVHDEAGSGTTSNVGNTVTVNVANAVFKSPIGGLDDHLGILLNLPFTPTFDSSHLGKGQSVEADVDGQIAAGATPAANKIHLRQQAISGTVAAPAAGSTATFSLMLDSDSAFAKLTSITSLDVYQVSKSVFMGMNSVTPGAKVKVRGFLLFNNGNYVLVAARIAQP